MMTTAMTGRGCASSIAALVLSGVVTAHGQDDAGKQAFSDAGCVMCHGPRGRGADGPALVPMDRTHTGLARIVREGIGEMPGLADDVVTDEQIDLVHRYLTELSGGAVLEAVDNAAHAAPARVAGAADAGKQAFSDAGCVMCHGPRGRGADGPALVPIERTYEGLARIVREGIGEMPGLADDVVTDEQISLVHQYLTALSGAS